MFQPWKSAIDLTTTFVIKEFFLQFYGKWFFNNPGQCFLSILGGGLVMLLWYFRGQVVHLQGVQGCFFYLLSC